MSSYSIKLGDDTHYIHGKFVWLAQNNKSIKIKPLTVFESDGDLYFGYGQDRVCFVYDCFASEASCQRYLDILNNKIPPDKTYLIRLIRANDLEDLGDVISVYCRWDIVKIFNIFMGALTDSNAHSLVSILEKMFKKWVKDETKRN